MLRRLSRQDGQGLVEFAVVFPIFILLVFVIIDGGILMGRYGTINHSASEGARAIAVNGGIELTRDEVEDRARTQIKAQAHGLLDGAGSDCSADNAICFDWGTGPNGEVAGEVGSTVKVTLKYNYTLRTPLWGNLFTDGINVEACAVARVERPTFFDNSITDSVAC